MARSHPGDLTQAWTGCVCGLRDTLWGLLCPLCQETGGRAGDGIPYCPLGLGPVWEEGRPYRTLPSPAICSLFPRCLLCSLPVVCSSTLHLFAVLSSGVHKQHPSCAVITDTSSPHPSCHGHLPSCRQLPPSARHNFSPAVCSHHPSYLQFPSPF